VSVNLFDVDGVAGGGGAVDGVGIQALDHVEEGLRLGHFEATSVCRHRRVVVLAPAAAAAAAAAGGVLTVRQAELVPYQAVHAVRLPPQLRRGAPEARGGRIAFAAPEHARRHHPQPGVVRWRLLLFHGHGPFHAPSSAPT
jgi:hypothetical protein